MQLPPFTLHPDAVRGRTILVTGATSGADTALNAAGVTMNTGR